MNKFDEFLKERSETERSKFTVSKKYDENLEKCLNDLGSKKQIRWNKTIVSLVACFIFVLLTGFSLREMNINKSLNDNSRISNISEDDKSIQNRTYEESNSILNINNIKAVTFKVLGENSTYKFIDDEENISLVIQYINSIAIKEIDKVDIKEWDILIQINGVDNHSIIIDNNIMNIDDRYFEIDDTQVEGVKSIYYNLSYEEIPIKYCNTPTSF